MMCKDTIFRPLSQINIEILHEKNYPVETCRKLFYKHIRKAFINK